MKTPSVTDPHLKDVYDTWLKGLREDDPAKLVKRLQRRAATAKHNGAGASSHSTTTKSTLRALQRPTEASASKHVAQREDPKLPALVQTNASREDAELQRQDAQRRRHQATADEANCATYAYRAPLEPGLAFFVLLASAACRATNTTASDIDGSLRSFPIRIPPTLVRTRSCQKSSATRIVLLFTQAERDGDESSLVLHAQEFATEQQFRARRQGLLRIFTEGGGERTPELDGPVAVSKHGNDSCKRNDTFLLTSVEDVEVALDSLWSAHGDIGGGPCAIQKLVSCKGGASAAGSSGRKAWVARPVYRKKDRASWVWILTDSGSSELTDSSHDACQIVRQRLEALLRVSFSELALDLIQDHGGKWWLLQVKAFRVRSPPRRRPLSASVDEDATVAREDSGGEKRVKSAPDRFGGASAGGTAALKKWRCAGKFCGTHDGADFVDSLASAAFSASPSGYWTKKVLLSCEFFDAYMTQRDMSLTSGFADVSAALAFHLQYQISKRERNQLYEPQPLCSACVGKYHCVREQWLKAAAGGSENQRAKQTSGRKPIQQHALGSEARARPESSYLSEMDRIEELLAAHDTHFASATSGKAKSKATGGALCAESPQGSGDTSDSNDLDATSRRVSQLLQQRRADAADSVEEMWKRYAYNSWSLASELEKQQAAELPDTPSQPANVHTITLQNCRDVFFDEAFRERVVAQATEQLLMNVHVRIEVASASASPLDGQLAAQAAGADSGSPSSISTPSCEGIDRDEQREMTAMALRTLFLDLAQSVPEPMAALFRGRPAIIHEASGCTTLDLRWPGLATQRNVVPGAAHEQS
ncbi:hypothetical protein PybrP1_000831 [[Pythium] brassicae (nom. inval.)]|nr:hypothetical protein PybrP1_000831 [[Pythium] brassicae (nom. inval.)]